MSVSAAQLKLFLSYRRADSEPVILPIHDALETAFGQSSTFIDVDLGAGNWRQKIERAILNSQVGLVVIGERWLTVADESGERRLWQLDDVVRREVELALTHCTLVVILTVNGAPVPAADDLPRTITRLPDNNAFTIRDPQADPAGFEADMTRVIRAIRREFPVLFPPAAPQPDPVPQPRATPPPAKPGGSLNRGIAFGVAGVILLAVVGAIFTFLPGLNPSATPTVTLTHTPAQEAALGTVDPLLITTMAIVREATETRAAEMTLTLQALMEPSLPPLPLDQSTATPAPFDPPVPTPTRIIPTVQIARTVNFADAFSQQQVIVMPTPTETQDVAQGITQGITQDFSAALQTVDGSAESVNMAWETISEIRDGVPAMLVPAGCFMMGDDPTAFYFHSSMQTFGETGVPAGGLQCLDAFWIDRTEVSRDDFTRLAGVFAFEGWMATGDGLDDSHPVNNVTWEEAQNFCILRGGLLPTEVQWEYAARGPDGWRFATGDTFISENVNWNMAYAGETAPVGFFSDVSWVGALDMAGNVSEWTRSTGAPYPYQHDDGREIGADDTPSVPMALRGASWSTSDQRVLPAAARDAFSADTRSTTLGFRCAFRPGDDIPLG